MRNYLISEMLVALHRYPLVNVGLVLLILGFVLFGLYRLSNSFADNYDEAMQVRIAAENSDRQHRDRILTDKNPDGRLKGVQGNHGKSRFDDGDN